jgi:hypothetical protein
MGVWRNGRHQKPSQQRRLRLDLGFIVSIITSPNNLPRHGHKNQMFTSDQTMWTGSHWSECCQKKWHSYTIILKYTYLCPGHRDGSTNSWILKWSEPRKHCIEEKQYLSGAQVAYCKMHRSKIHDCSLLIQQIDAFPRTRGRGTSR